jgi:PAS domain S-box-containing protein
VVLSVAQDYSGSCGLVLIFSILFLIRHKWRFPKRESVLSDSQLRLNAIFRSALDPVVVTDSKGIILDWNNAAIGCFGFNRDQAIGLDFTDLILPERSRAAHRGVLAHYLATGDSSVLGKRAEIQALHLSGKEIPVELALGVSRGLDNPVFVAYLRNIEKRLEVEANLKQALETAMAANLAKASFLAVMSHEMRTPLNGVIGCLDLLENTTLNSDQSGLVTTAIKSGEALLSQISDVLDFSKMEAGKLDLELAPFNVRDLIDSVATILESQAKAQNNCIQIVIDSDVPRWLLGDAMRLRQILLNFASNAVKFTTDGIVKLEVKKLSSDDISARYQFSVVDTGIGISPESIENLFKEFSMVDNSYKRRSGGTGLGLAISKILVTAMGGQTGVLSKIASGSHFWFELILETAEPIAKKSAIEVAEFIPQPKQNNLRILLAEDNLTNQMVAVRMLAAAGHSVETAIDGTEALAKVQSEDFDLIFMDISMPVMDGLEAAFLIRALPEPKNKIPIIAMTANAVLGDRERFLEAGMTRYLSKPIRKSDILAALVDIEIVQSTIMKTQADIVAGGLLLIENTELEKLAKELGPDILPVVLRQFIVEVELRCPMASQAFLQGDLEGVRKATHALSGICATVGAQDLRSLAEAIEVGHGEMEYEVLASRLQQLSEVAKLTVAAFNFQNLAH